MVYNTTQLPHPTPHSHTLSVYTELVFLNVYGAQESILRNEFRQPMKPDGSLR
jgi:hypothetical protein